MRTPGLFVSKTSVRADRLLGMFVSINQGWMYLSDQKPGTSAAIENQQTGITLLGTIEAKQAISLILKRLSGAYKHAVEHSDVLVPLIFILGGKKHLQRL